MFVCVCFLFLGGFSSGWLLVSSKSVSSTRVSLSCRSFGFAWFRRVIEALNEECLEGTSG